MLRVVSGAPCCIPTYLICCDSILTRKGCYSVIFFTDFYTCTSSRLFLWDLQPFSFNMKEIFRAIEIGKRFQQFLRKTPRLLLLIVRARLFGELRFGDRWWQYSFRFWTKWNLDYSIRTELSTPDCLNQRKILKRAQFSC